MIAGTVLARIGARRERRRPPHQLLDPPGRPRRPADRPEAHPRRLEAARGDGDLPRQGQEPASARSSSGAGVLLLPKEALEAAGPRRRAPLDLRLRPRRYRSGQIDRRVLAILEYLVAKGFRLTITSLKCGHGFLHARPATSPSTLPATRSTSQTINGVPVSGHQGPGNAHRRADQAVLRLQGTMHPAPADLARGSAGRAELRPARPLRPRPHRLPPARAAPARPAVQRPAETQAVAAPDRSARRRSTTPRADLAVAVSLPTRARQGAHAGAAQRRLKIQENRGFWPSSSDSCSSSSPARLPWRTAATWPATGTRTARRACWSSRPWARPRRPGGGAGGAGRRSPRPSPAPCRWRGPPRCGPSSPSTRPRTPPAGWTESVEARRHGRRAWSPRAWLCSTAPCTRTRRRAPTPTARS